ncbi:NfeD family protein [Haloplasma contractile]|uniref:Integral membrane protein n=1 Tax=Haloplasma contractile SSD-17B TaxID=1033810 RepID=U2DVQ1_9MOLU|nr:NfeD family protein [Haloplasma contractile]ERJ12442.1 Putative integral membrane protein [Haloplasma contractile SSD-17B]
MPEEAALVWLILGILLFIIEALTFSLVTVWFSLGAFVTMFVAMAFPDNIPLQIAVFLVTSIILLVFTRDIAIKKLKVGTIKTNVESLVGKRAIVTKRIEEFNYGEVRINGKYWTAKSYDGATIEVETIVEITAISGVKLVVKKSSEQ